LRPPPAARWPPPRHGNAVARQLSAAAAATAAVAALPQPLPLLLLLPLPLSPLLLAPIAGRHPDSAPFAIEIGQYWQYFCSPDRLPRPPKASIWPGDISKKSHIPLDS